MRSDSTVKSNKRIKKGAKGVLKNFFKEHENDGETFEIKSFNQMSSAKWYEEIKDDDEITSVEVNNEELEKLKKQASSIFNEAIILNNTRTPKSISKSDHSWMKTVMSKGTKTDKIAAYTLLIQDSPLHNLSLVNSLIEMVKVGKKKECFMAIESLSELFLNDLLPPNRKLRYFNQQPLSKISEISSGNVSTQKKRLFLWYFEDQLKSLYGDFINHLNKIAHDSVDANKEKVITVMCKLLEGHPEKENVLLSNVVNKLGDPSHKVGSKVIYVLTKLLQTHPNMREVVADSVEKVIFRSNISKRAQYYSVCFLSQFCLFNGESKLAKKLISIYLSLFKACIKMGDVDTRMMSALLTGVNRSYPYAKTELGMLKEHIDTVYKVIHLSHANVAIQALSLVYLTCDYSHAYTDRFYSVLYKKIAETDMFKSSHHAMLLSLIFKAIKSDKEKNRICAFIKRLFQICTYVSIPLACGILIMVSEVIRAKKDILIRESVFESNEVVKLEDNEDSDDEEHYEDIKEEETPLSKREVKEGIQNNKANVGFIFNNSSEENVKVWCNPDKSVAIAKDAEVCTYDPLVRNPLYAGANKTLCYELHKLMRHFHPTVSLFANKIINGENIVYSGDPLLDFTLIRFLDKFSFKNPKALKTENEKNLTFSKFGRKKYYSSATVRRLRANTADYLNHSEKNIPVDEIFLYRYMKEKCQSTPITTKEDESDVESVGSDEFEEMLNDLADDKKDDIDFLNEVGQLSKKTKKKKGKDESESEEDDDDDFDDDDDPKGDEGNEESDDGSFAEDFEGDEVDDFGDDDEEMQGSDLDEAELEAAFGGFKLPKITNMKEKKKKLKKKGKGDFTDNLFASAEEFSELLEEADYNGGGSEALSNKDKAGVKQLKWECERDKWINKKNYKSKQGRNARFEKKFKKIKKSGKKKRF